jgi:Lhr-like helicase
MVMEHATVRTKMPFQFAPVQGGGLCVHRGFGQFAQQFGTRLPQGLRGVACVLERFFDQSGGMQLVLHAPFGSRINKAWGLALRKRFCRSFNFELQAAATDNGLNIALAEQHSFPLGDVFHFLNAETVQPVLEQAD